MRLGANCAITQPVLDGTLGQDAQVLLLECPHIPPGIVLDYAYLPRIIIKSSYFHFTSVLVWTINHMVTSVIVCHRQRLGGDLHTTVPAQHPAMSVSSAVECSLFPFQMKLKKTITTVHTEAPGQWNWASRCSSSFSPTVITGCSASLAPTPS